MSLETPITAAQIVARYKAGERSFVGLDLDECEYNFDGAALAGADFSSCFIVGSFRGANLANARFLNANVKTCDFSHANLKHASFEGACIDGAIFSDAQLDESSFCGASAYGYTFGLHERP